MTPERTELRISRVLWPEHGNNKSEKQMIGSDCQRYGIFNEVADNVDKYS